MSLSTSLPILGASSSGEASPNTASQNQILTALPSESYTRLLPKLENVSLIFKQVIYEPGELIQYVYFPLSGVVSLLTILSDGTETEVGIVGNEGITGISVFLGIDVTSIKAIVQIPGDAMRMRTSDFKAALLNGALHSLLQRYTQTLIGQISQTVACNSHHSVEERCCRWLLMCGDRAKSDNFPITQEFLSHMLGVRRASVTVVAGMLQKAGLISYSRGHMTILDRPGLEKVSCECYESIKSEFDRVFGVTVATMPEKSRRADKRKVSQELSGLEKQSKT
jgi:CRP-like cAMP-binding protein